MKIKIKTYAVSANTGNKISLAFLIIILLITFMAVNCSKKIDVSIQQAPKNDTTVKSVNNNDSVNLVKLSYGQEQGSILFRKYCSVCHGETGKGNGFNSYNLNPHPRNFTDSNFAMSHNLDHLQLVISSGGKAGGRSALMRPYGGTLKSNEIEYLAQYIVFLGSYKK